MIKKLLLALMAVVFVFGTVGAGLALDKGNKRKGKYIYRKVYKSCFERGAIDSNTPPLSPADKTQAEENPQSIYLVDVRDPDEFAAGHFQTAVNIPVGELEESVDTLPAEKPIVFVCSTGARSGESYYMLQDIKPELKKVYYLEAEVEYNIDGSYKIKKNE